MKKPYKLGSNCFKIIHYACFCRTYIIVIIYLLNLNLKTGIPDTLNKHTAKNITDTSLHEIFVAVCLRKSKVITRLFLQVCEQNILFLASIQTCSCIKQAFEFHRKLTFTDIYLYRILVSTGLTTLKINTLSKHWYFTN